MERVQGRKKETEMEDIHTHCVCVCESVCVVCVSLLPFVGIGNRSRES